MDACLWPATLTIHLAAAAGILVLLALNVMLGKRADRAAAA
jgi:hypothetical protein